MSLIIIHKKTKEGIDFLNISKTTLLNFGTSLIFPLYTLWKYLNYTISNIQREQQEDEKADNERASVS